jgi:WhiB family redox-sensing transcriptional regulator
MKGTQMSTWSDRAACKSVPPEHVEFFFADLPEFAGGLETARGYCASCPVRALCLEDAIIKGRRVGIRGGLLPVERDELAAGGRPAAMA